MRILYLDCFSGVAGDMLVGSLLDLGLPLEDLREQLGALGLRGYAVSARRTVRAGISGTQFSVKVTGHHHHRGWKEIRKIIEGSDLPEPVSHRALAIFRRLIEVEARIHRIPVEKVHLHEVGAVDAIVDIVGAVIGLRHFLGSRGELRVSPLHLGRGKVKMAHGSYPVPPPATLALLKGVPVLSGPVEGELVTPTGAAIVSSMADGFGPMPPMTITAAGYGAGSRKYEDHPNMLRVLLGEAGPAGPARETVVVAECTIDDMNPQAYGHLMERLFDAGALEVYYTPVQMKKSRPGVQVTIISPEGRFGELASIVFRESTTIGLRHRTVERIELARETIRVATPFGRIRVKVSSLDGRPVQAQPEYDDCLRAAAKHRTPLREVQAAAAASYRATLPGDLLLPPARAARRGISPGSARRRRAGTGRKTAPAVPRRRRRT